MDVVAHPLETLVKTPVALVMAAVALLCAADAVGLGRLVRLEASGRGRLAMAALAFICAMSAWMMVTRWRWPS